jgi:hypothetical protein
LGSFYGVGLYVISIAGIAPLIGLTEGEQNAPVPARAERLGLHLLHGMLTAMVTDVLYQPAVGLPLADVAPPIVMAGEGRPSPVFSVNVFLIGNFVYRWICGQRGGPRWLHAIAEQWRCPQPHRTTTAQRK